MTNRGDLLVDKRGHQWIYLGIWPRGINKIPYHWFVNVSTIHLEGGPWTYAARVSTTVKRMFTDWEGGDAC